MKQKVFLLPSLDDPYKSIVEIARQISDKYTIITDDFHKIKNLTKLNQISKVIIIMGAGTKNGCLNPVKTSKLLKKANSRIKIFVVDGRDWHIPGQFFLPGKSSVQVLKKALMT